MNFIFIYILITLAILSTLLMYGMVSVSSKLSRLEEKNEMLSLIKKKNNNIKKCD